MTGLFEQFISTDNLILAFKRIAAKKAGGGIDGVSIEAFGHRLEQNIKRLQQEIIEGRYIPHAVKAVYVPKFNKEDEWRQLGLPVVADKVVQAALLQVVEPLAEKIFLDCSYGYRPGKGPHRAVKQVEYNIYHRHRVWAVQRDIDNFFDSLDHERLLEQFSNLVNGDLRLVELVALWCKIGFIDRDGRWRNIQAGVRQGHVISPLLANLYLHPLDEFVTEKGWGWIRYADDFLLQCRVHSEAVEAEQAVIDFLGQTLKLEVNPNEQGIKHIADGFSFLGIYFKNRKKQIAPAKIEKMKRKIMWLLSERNKDDIEKILSDLAKMIEGWQRYYSFLNPEKEFVLLDKFIEEQFRQLITIRIKQEQWPNNPPPGLFLPSVHNQDELQDGRKRLEKIWKEASLPYKVSQIVEKKIALRRRRHLREQGYKGELFVTTPGHFIGRRKGRVIVRKKQQIIAELPVIQLRYLTVAAHGVGLSADVIELCARKDVPIHFVDEVGRIFAAFSPTKSIMGETLLLQVNHRNTEKGLLLAKMFVFGKVKNQYALLKYYGKYPVHQERIFGKVLKEKEEQMKKLIMDIKQIKLDSEPENLRQTLMGLEGAFASIYWLLIRCLLKGKIDFPGRIRRGAKDLVNSALNYGYGILYGRAFNAIIRAGLNPVAGFLHSYQAGKPVLVHDIVEEFRPMVVDRTIFSLINRGEKLSQEENGILTSETKKKLVRAVIRRLNSEVYFHGRKLSLEKVIEVQAQNIKKYLHDKIKYRPFLARW